MPDLPAPGPVCAGCAARDAEIAALQEQADEAGELRARVEELHARIARLERTASRNSGNSFDAAVGG